MAKYEVAFSRREVVFTRYYITVEAENSEAAKKKVWSFDTTVAEEATIVEGKCLGMGESVFDSVDWVQELEKVS